jgi:hypothetical protein
MGGRVSSGVVVALVSLMGMAEYGQADDAGGGVLSTEAVENSVERLCPKRQEWLSSAVHMELHDF